MAEWRTDEKETAPPSPTDERRRLLDSQVAEGAKIKELWRYIGLPQSDSESDAIHKWRLWSARNRDVVRAIFGTTDENELHSAAQDEQSPSFEQTIMADIDFQTRVLRSLATKLPLLDLFERQRYAE